MRRRILGRILGLMALLIAITGVAMSGYQIRLQRNQQIASGREKIRLLIKQLEPLFLWDDQVAMRQAVVHAVEGDEFVLYAFVERNGRSIAHSFPHGVPKGLLNLSDVSDGIQVRELKNERGQKIYDLAVATVPNSAIVHLGLDRQKIDRVSVPSLLGIAAICCLFFLLLIYPAARTARVITNEIDEMTSRLREENQRLEDRVAERTADLRMANKRLDAGRENLAVTLRSIGDGVITTDVDGRIQLLNRVAEELTGWKQEEALGRQLQEVFHIVNQISRQTLENPVDIVLRKGGAVGLANHTVLIAKDGRERRIADSGAPIRDTEGQIIGVVLTFRDVTEKERLELNLQRAEKLESIGVLAGGIAHDFNNLLTAILGNVNLARLLMSSHEPVCKHLERAEQAATKASELALRLLTFAKGSTPVKKAHAIETIIRDAANLALSGSQTRCSLEFQPNLPAVEVDAGQIGQVIHNLLLNADQSMVAGGGEVSVRCQAVLAENQDGIPISPGLYVRVIVEDHGEGIPKDQLIKIFDPFYTTKDKGSGLGLAIVHSIVKNHGGHVTVASEVGKGTTVSLYLPTTGTLPEVQTIDALAVEDGKGRVLVMDDEEMLRELLSGILKQVGYEVECAAHGEEAIDKCLQAKDQGDAFALLILDLTIPGGVGGRETIRRLREQGITARAIASSGYSSDPIMSDPYTYGFDATISKPYNIYEFCRTIQKVLVNSPQGK